MTKKQIVIGVGLLLSVGALFALWFSTPHIAKWYVLRNYPYVKSVGAIDVGWKCAEVYNLYVEKENINANINYLHINTEKQVEIVGGNITIVQQEGVSGSGQPSTPSAGEWKIKASELEVAITTNGATANVHDVNYNEGKVCFTSGQVRYKGTAGSFGKGCVWPSQRRGYIDKAEASIDLPKIPQIAETQKVIAEDIRFHWGKKEIEISKLWVGDVLHITDGTFSIDDQFIYASIHSVNFKHPWVTDGFVMYLGVTVPRSLDGTITMRTSHTRGGEERVVNINIDLAKHKVWGNAQCADWMLVLPHIEAIHDGGYSNMSGELSFEVGLKPPSMKLKNKCKIKCDFKAIADLKRKFSYVAIDPKGKTFERVTGPYVPGWVFIETLPPYVPEAFIRMEDPGYRHHTGVLRKALEVSLGINLEKGRFVRGGSTITMQLVKNLWLGRQKTIDRKAAEIILAHMMNGCFTKDQILEHYINVIEFGPKVYGIRAGAWHYFQKKPQDLLPEEAVYLARVLPKPNRPRDPVRGIDRTRKMIKLWKEIGTLPEDFGDNAE